jgi:ankyrin repeat protein
LAVLFSKYRLAEVLLSTYHHDIHAPNEDAQTPLQIACGIGDIKMIQLLLQYDANRPSMKAFLSTAPEMTFKTLASLQTLLDDHDDLSFTPSQIYKTPFWTNIEGSDPSQRLLKADRYLIAWREAGKEFDDSTSGNKEYIFAC